MEPGFSEHLYSEMNGSTTFLCDSCNSSKNHYLYRCNFCNLKACCSCTHKRSFCSCNRAYSNVTSVIENTFFLFIHDHSCKIQPASTQQLTNTVREILIESGVYREQQIFAKTLIDHLLKSCHSNAQSQLVINILARLVAQYGNKLEKAF